MIVVNLEGFIIGEAPEIVRVNAQGQENLIKVNLIPEISNGFYYIGDINRDLFQILDINTPDNTKVWKYINGQFEEFIDESGEPI